MERKQKQKMLDSFVVTDKSEPTGEDIWLLGVEVYAYGPRDMMDNFGRNATVVVIVRGEVIHRNRLESCVPHAVEGGRYWVWSLEEPHLLVSGDMFVDSTWSILARIEYDGDPGFGDGRLRVWTFPLLTGLDDGGLPTWFEKWKTTGKLPPLEEREGSCYWLLD